MGCRHGDAHTFHEGEITQARPGITAPANRGVGPASLNHLVNPAMLDEAKMQPPGLVTPRLRRSPVTSTGVVHAIGDHSNYG